MTGYDIELISKIREAVNIPISVLGGAGSIEDIVKLLDSIDPPMIQVCLIRQSLDKLRLLASFVVLLQELPLILRSRLFDGISVLLCRGLTVDTCLQCIVSLLYNQSPANHSNSVLNHSPLLSLPPQTIRNIMDGLFTVSGEASERGVLAARLEYELQRLASVR